MSGARDVGGGLVLTRREQIVSLVLAFLMASVFAWLVLVEVRS